jgi:MFS family permease
MGIGPTLTTFIWITLHMLGQAIGGIFFPPYSESFGRKNLYILSATLSTVCCIISASTSSIWAPIWSRLACGFLSAIPSNVVAGTIEDLWDFKQRTWAIFSWALAADIGVVCGTVIGNELMTIRDWCVCHLAVSLTIL